MTVSKYDYLGSKLIISMDEDLANGFNKVSKAFTDAQLKFEKEQGRKVTQDDIIRGELIIEASRFDVACYNKVCDFMNNLYKEGLKIKEEDITSDFLEKI